MTELAHGKANVVVASCWHVSMACGHTVNTGLKERSGSGWILHYRVMSAVMGLAWVGMWRLKVS